MLLACNRGGKSFFPRETLDGHNPTNMGLIFTWTSPFFSWGVINTNTLNISLMSALHGTWCSVTNFVWTHALSSTLHVCMICYEIFRTNMSSTAFSEIRWGEGFVCNNCYMGFYPRTSLKSHMRSHTGGNPMFATAVTSLSLKSQEWKSNFEPKMWFASSTSWALSYLQHDHYIILVTSQSFGCLDERILMGDRPIASLSHGSSS